MLLQDIISFLKTETVYKPTETLVDRTTVV